MWNTVQNTERDKLPFPRLDYTLLRTFLQTHKDEVEYLLLGGSTLVQVFWDYPSTLSVCLLSLDRLYFSRSGVVDGDRLGDRKDFSTFYSSRLRSCVVVLIYLLEIWVLLVFKSSVHKELLLPYFINIVLPISYTECKVFLINKTRFFLPPFHIVDKMETVHNLN